MTYEQTTRRWLQRLALSNLLHFIGILLLGNVGAKAAFGSSDPRDIITGLLGFGLLLVDYMVNIGFIRSLYGKSTGTFDNLAVLWIIVSLLARIVVFDQLAIGLVSLNRFLDSVLLEVFIALSSLLFGLLMLVLTREPIAFTIITRLKIFGAINCLVVLVLGSIDFVPIDLLSELGSFFLLVKGLILPLFGAIVFLSWSSSLSTFA